MFVVLLENLRDDIISFCFKFFPKEPDQVAEQQRDDPSRRMRTVKDSATNMGIRGAAAQENEGAKRGKQKPVVRVEEKVGRNDPCPCGSGKKYKHCHGKAGG